MNFESKVPFSTMGFELAIFTFAQNFWILGLVAGPNWHLVESAKSAWIRLQRLLLFILSLTINFFAIIFNDGWEISILF